MAKRKIDYQVKTFDGLDLNAHQTYMYWIHYEILMKYNNNNNNNNGVYL